MNEIKSHWPSIAVILTALLSAGITKASDDTTAEATNLSIRCHELIKGLPDPRGAVYVLRDKKLYRNKIVISSEDGTILSSIGGDIRSAAHVFDGKKLTRTLYSQVGSQPKEAIDVEVFDFKNQKIIDDGEDTCYHNATFPKTQ